MKATLKHFDRVEKVLEQGVADGVFPGAVLLVAAGGEVLFFEAAGHASLVPEMRPMGRETVFDLASLTKPLATTLALIRLVDEERLDLDRPLEALLPGPLPDEKRATTPRLLLCHSAGLIDWRPYYLKLDMEPEGIRKTVLRRWVLEESMAYEPGKGVLYSDLGFMLLEWVVEICTGMTLPAYLAETFYGPLGLQKTFFIETLSVRGGDKRKQGDKAFGLDSGFRRNGGREVSSKGVKAQVTCSQKAFAATEDCPWRKKVMHGEVHDENAYAAGGYSGHAGLFGRARDVHNLVNCLREHFLGQRSDFFRPETVQAFFKRQGMVKESTWALGWDTPSKEGSSAGKYISAKSVGHLGFTGTSVWMDLEKDVIVVLLTNRVHPTRNNQKIRAFRPKIHNAIMKGLV